MERINLGGFLSRKQISVNYGKLSIQDTSKEDLDLAIDDITTLFIENVTLNSGFVHFSTNGDIVDAPINHVNTLHYKEKDADQVNRVVDAVLKENPEIQVVYVTREFDMDKDPAVIEHRGPLKCPNCQSINLDFMGNQRKSFSVGKAVAGGLLTGGVGAVAGFAGKKGDDRWRCRDCGNIFDTKNKK